MQAVGRQCGGAGLATISEAWDVGHVPGRMIWLPSVMTRTGTSAGRLVSHRRRRPSQVWEALAAARIDLRRARVVVEGTARLAETATREVVDRILEGGDPAYHRPAAGPDP